MNCKDQLNLVTQERNMAISMLAYWIELVDNNGTGWDDWDEGYKDAISESSIKYLIDASRAEAKKYWTKNEDPKLEINL